MQNVQNAPPRARQRARARPRPMPRETLEPRRTGPEDRSGPERSGRIPPMSAEQRAALESIYEAEVNAIPADTVGQVSEKSVLRPEDRTLAEVRRYARPDLYAVAELGHQYLFAGGIGVAEAVFEGLTAVAPREAYFHLALGLVRSRQNRIDDAERAFAKAASLDPHDGRADVNRAEIRLQKRDFRKARQLLAAGADKARRRGDNALHQKADALLARLSRR